MFFAELIHGSDRLFPERLSPVLFLAGWEGSFLNRSKKVFFKRLAASLCLHHQVGLDSGLQLESNGHACLNTLKFISSRKWRRAVCTQPSATSRGTFSPPRTRRART